jgi:hypothetical protein
MTNLVNDTPMSVVWKRIMSLTDVIPFEEFSQRHGARVINGDVHERVYGYKGFILTVRVDGDAISAQIDNPNKRGFPKRPWKFEVEGSVASPVLSTEQGQLSPDKFFEYLMSLLREMADAN